MKFNTIVWEDEKIKIIDQTQLPEVEKIIELDNVEKVIEAIKELRVRGAPLIGITAAYGAVVAAKELIGIHIPDIELYKKLFFEKIDKILNSRPTAVNLKNCLDIVKNKFNEVVAISIENPINLVKQQVYENLLYVAKKLHEEDEKICESIGIHGNKLINNNDTILTHCNAGSLATTAWGTALSVIYKAFEDGKKIKVYSDETRPLLQGSRLTAYELLKKGIDVTTICDNMAGFLMKQKKIDKIIVGADRICLNGDFANKIGTYSLAVLAKAHHIPFFVAAPYTTFDKNIKKGEQIPIEFRSPDEIKRFKGFQLAPENVNVYNPAFDVTQSKYVTAFITESGIIYPPYKTNIKKYLKERGIIT
ncbi:MAG: S-methyl-5-thioribose-1-phosphate isomerase [Spirochaetales bacterium]|nr:S-methyl-5-thioribose-1-phosphate isomerase [Spirochaetales bacterium]